MKYYANTPLAKKGVCPDHDDHNRLAKQFNLRLSQSGPDCLWRIFSYADSIFSSMRNTLTPFMPLGTSPPEDEWWKIHMNIEEPTAATGAGNWPFMPAGFPGGAQTIHPLNAYMFGSSRGAHGYYFEKEGPFAEGNLFDGLVETGSMVFNNSQFWESSFRQRGAIAKNKNSSSSSKKVWEGYKANPFYSGRSKYLPSPYDPIHISRSLFVAGRTSDQYFKELASSYGNMRYPPSVVGGSYRGASGNRQPEVYSKGILKRKNATKELMQWGLWAYVYYFKGSEQQRSLFCKKKGWSAPLLDLDTTGTYSGEQIANGLVYKDSKGPLNICKVGFDFYKYYTRQNVFAPVVGIPLKKKLKYESLDGKGNPVLEQYRPKYKFSIPAILPEDDRGGSRPYFCSKGLGSGKGFGGSGMNLENYDEGTISTGIAYGKTLRFYEERISKTKANSNALFWCSYDNYNQPEGSERKTLNIKNVTGGRFPACLAGYYLETTAVGNPDMKFKFRIWSGNTKMHETVIDRKFSYSVNANAERKGFGRKAYIYNKVFYFKEGLEKSSLKFEIVPMWDDPEMEGAKDKLISFGNPFTSTVEKTSLGMPYGYTANTIQTFGPDIWVPVAAVDDLDLVTGDCIKMYTKTSDGGKTYVAGGGLFFIRRYSGKSKAPTPEGVNPNDVAERKKLLISTRQDGRIFKGNLDTETELFDIGEAIKSGTWYIEKMELPSDLFSVSLDLAILLKSKPSLQDAYSLFRVSTEKQNRMDLFSMMTFGDAPGVGVVGHDFNESAKISKNYFRYGSAMNIYGSDKVPVLKQSVSANPIYESMRKFVSSFLRFADRHQLVNYTIEGGKGVLYFKRYAHGVLAKVYRATVLRHMEPPVEPAGWFEPSLRKQPKFIGHSKFVPIKDGKKYKVVCTGSKAEGVYVKYNSIKYENGEEFTGEKGIDFLEENTVTQKRTQGAFQVFGITSSPNKTETNQWVMFLTSHHYHHAVSHIYKPAIYTDIMCFLNNRCHHRSLEYERRSGVQYDMIRHQLSRVSGTQDVGPRLHLFLSKSSNNFNYIFNTNDPSTRPSNVQDSYGVQTGNPITQYYKSCPPVTPKPYKVVHTTVCNSSGKDYTSKDFNPSSMKIGGRRPFELIRVQLDRPLRRSGKLGIGVNGWGNVNWRKLKDENYRTDENAIVEYLLHKNIGYGCSKLMIGDYGAHSGIIGKEKLGWTPYGACYPRFYFLKLIPKVPAGALLDTEPYAQMDFYLRGCAGAFVNPYANPSWDGETSVLNWKHTELASRSSEDDPTAWHHISPGEVQS